MRIELPQAVHRSCSAVSLSNRPKLEDYRAGLGVDRAADDTERSAGRWVQCPTLIAWSTRDDM
jgi:hypothetical protein